MDRLNLLDVQKRMVGEDSTSINVAEILNKTQPLLMDGVWMPTNKTDSRTTLVRAGLPDVHRRRANEGTLISKSAIIKNEEATTSFEAYSETDVRVIDSFAAAKAEARAMEAVAFIEAVGQAMCKDFYYGNQDTDPDGIYGLANRYNSLTSGNEKRQIINAGGTGTDNASIWLVKWYAPKVSFIYPKHAMDEGQGVVEHEDLGAGTTNVGTGTERRILKVYRDRFSISGGWCLSDYQAVARIANIDVSDLKTQSMQRNPADASNPQSKLRFFMAQLMYRMPPGGGNMRFYMNRTVAQYLDLESMAAVNSAGMTYIDVQGQMVPAFRGVPIRLDDTLLNSEAQVS